MVVIGNRKFILLVISLACMGTASAQQNSDPRVADLVRAGKVRVGLFSTQFSKDPTTGELRGVRPDMARALAERIGVPVAYVFYRDTRREATCAAVCAPFVEQNSAH